MVGNMPNFTALDVLRTFLYSEDGMSRQALMGQVGVGEGTIRSILNILKKQDLIISTKHGHFLTRKGIARKKAILRSISLPKKVMLPFYQGYEQRGILIKAGAAKKVGYQERDAAVREGAEGAILLQKKKNKWTIPGYPGYTFPALENIFPSNEGNIVAIAFAKNKRAAENGCLAMAEKVVKIKI
ncbi:hypothetical protein HYS48_01565 [Candidatus Woesearchaeota archaeon]|nr:hypothetical protein [Candidatus Woesearchaeota archaeon]